MTSIALRGNTAILLRRQFKSLFSKVSVINGSVENHTNLGGYSSPAAGTHNSAVRTFSHVEVGSITRQLKKLDTAVVRRIEDELREVDKDSDGR